MPEEKRNTVKVGCTVPNGLELRLYKLGHPDESGSRRQVPEGPTVTLRGAETPVDAEFWRAWLAQNERTTFVTEKQVYLIEPEGEQERHDGH